MNLIPTQGEICDQAQNATNENCAAYNIFLVWLWHIGKFFNDYGVAITALAGVAVAGFTLALWRSTEKLWASGDRQIDLIAKSTRAAVIQANAAINADRPFVYISDVQVHPLPSGTNADGSETPDPYTPVFIFTNYGRTPAFVNFIGYGFCVGLQPPEIPKYQRTDDLTTEIVIRPNESCTFDQFLVLLAVQPDQKADVRAGNIFMWFWGKIQFRDVFGGISETGFVAMREPERRRGHIVQPESIRFAGPKAYVYQTYIHNHET